MREIKFRAWDKVNARFRDIESIIIARNNKPASIVSSGEFYEIQSNSQIELIQYTGKKDENGKEIYEGDILHCWGEDDSYIDDSDNEIFNKQIGVVKWGGIEYPAFEIYTKGHSKYNDSLSDDYNSFADDYYRYEVIGNIYENKELLKDKK